MTKKLTESLPLETLDGWDQLEQNQQKKVIERTESAKKNKASYQQSKLSFGSDLFEIREILLPAGMWVEYCKNIFHMSTASAYRYIGYFEVTSKKLSKPLIDFAIQTGYEIPLKAVESSRPPKSEDPEEMERYLERINTKTKKVIIIDHNPNDILKGLLNDVILGFGKLPKNPRTRSTFIRNFIGMLMTQFGIAHEQTFSPVAIPEHFRVKRGRPRINEAA